MASQLARQKAAQAWCRPTTSSKVMDGDLAEAFAEILDEVWSRPWLGNATTGELLDEVKARVDCNYKTVGGEELAGQAAATADDAPRDWIIYRVNVVLAGVMSEGPAVGIFNGTKDAVQVFCDNMALESAADSGTGEASPVGYKPARPLSIV